MALKNQPKGPPKLVYTTKTQQLITTYASFPPKFRPFITQKARWKSIRGGRGGGKTVSIAKALLLMGKERQIRVLCCREIQQSIKESVHKTLEAEIANLGLQSYYTVEKASIYGPTIKGKRTEFIFAGLKNNPAQLKSYADLDYAWVEEGQAVSEYSWTLLSPTIRNPESEIWISWNPEQELSATYRRFVTEPPDDFVDVEMNYWDNPWFGEPLVSEMEEMREKDYEKYLHVWCGQCVKFWEGAVYINELQQAELDNRITEVPYRADAPCYVYLDLGFADFTALWVAQPVGDFVHVIDFYQNRQKPLDHYLQWVESKPYVINRYWLPHDARQRTLAQPNSFESLMRSKGLKVQIIPSHLRSDGINALRTLFPRLRIDRKRCSVGIDALQHYRFELIDDGQGTLKQEPVHDVYSHACLTGDTLVDTERGAKRIDRIVAGERVWTPAGYAAVTWAGPVKQVRELVELKTSDGRVILCTPEHKIATKHGFLRADAVRYLDSLLTGFEFSCTLIGLLSKATNIGFRALITNETSGAVMAPVAYTARSGKTHTGRSLMAITSTIGMGIRSTTTWLTSIVCPPESICASTPWSFAAKESYTTRLNTRLSVPPNGIVQTLDTNGTSSMASKSPPRSNGFLAFVRSVVSSLCRRVLAVPSTATSTVKCLRYVGAGDSQWVYDLTVENHACYRANGILVSNSDAARYMAVAIRQPTEKTVPAGKYHDPSPFRGGSSSWMGL